MTRAVVLVFAVALFPTLAFSQRPIDLDKVAPQYRDVAEARQAELVRQKACQSEADKEKIVRRDRASYVIRCMEAAEKAEKAEIGMKAKK